MLKEIIEVRPLDGYRLWLRFEDGAASEVDLAQMIQFDGVFAPVRERAYFVQVRVDPECGTIVWPNGADLDPLVLYSKVTGIPIPKIEIKTGSR